MIGINTAARLSNKLLWNGCIKGSSPLGISTPIILEGNLNISYKNIIRCIPITSHHGNKNIAMLAKVAAEKIKGLNMILGMYCLSVMLLP
jgi:hypothetical protein